jgi:hypothetical protein
VTAPPYPNEPAREEHVELDIDFPDQVRRWTVLVRVILAIPQWIVLVFFSIATVFVLVAGWFAALVLGRLPRGLYEFLASYLGWSTRFSGYLMLMTDRYPPFNNRDPYPVRVALPAQTRLNRAAVLFRFILIIPASVVSALVLGGWWPLFGLVTWVAELIVGRVPVLLFTTNAAVLRYSTRVLAYGSLITPTYPKKLFGDGQGGSGTARPTTRPLLLSTGAKVLVAICLVLGVLSYAQNAREAAEASRTGEFDTLVSTE